MNSLFARLLIIFSTALILFLIILVCIFYFGFRKSISEWQLNKEQEYLVYAESILQGVEIDIPSDIPFFVYDSNRKIIFTNRGQRKHDSNQSTTVPVYSGNTITGYYYAGYMNFVNDNTNIQFIDSLRDVIIIAVVISFLIALMFSLVFSRRLSRQAKSVSKNLKRISSGDYDISVAEKGVKEISQIATSANLLSKQLKKEHNLRIQWAEDLAHDLRTPLSALIAQFEGMRDGVLDLTPERIKKNLKEINRIRQLVSDLDELTKLDSPELRLNPEKIESAPFLNELKEQFSFEIDKKNIDIKYSFDVPFFTADKLLLHRALTNILSNAVRHTGPGGKIKLSINLNDKSILINVFNTGDKIPDKEINKVFDRLYRGEYARNTPGTGLGLTIAQKIAGIHNGTISIKSEDGTTVTITLPAGEFWYT